MYEESMIERETIKNLSSSRMEFGKNDRFVLEIKSEERILERLDGLVYRSCVGSMNGERGKISRQRESNAKFRPIEAESNNGRDPLAEGIGGDTHVTGVSRGWNFRKKIDRDSKRQFAKIWLIKFPVSPISMKTDFD